MPKERLEVQSQKVAENVLQRQDEGNIKVNQNKELENSYLRRRENRSEVPVGHFPTLHYTRAST